ncbi:MAG: hypothetical protein HDT40_01545 [Lachnospiraceae bacterium]|nr:hypothetical protein [Lachnospiraceae bacterium]
MKDNKIFKIIMVSIAVMSVCGVIIYSLITIISKSDSDTVSPEIMYGNILSLYKKALSEEWEFDLLEENKLNYLCRYYYHKGTALEDIGYTFYDINSDGIEELIVGDIEHSFIFDVYTYQDEQAILIAQSAERHQYDICEDGKLSTKGSNGAATTFYEFYVLEAGAKELKYIECVAFDSNLNPDNPYFYTTKGPGVDYTQIDEETADNIMEKYKVVNIGNLTPFAQYN